MNTIIDYVSEFGLLALAILIIFFTIKSLMSQILKHHHSNWNTLLDGFNFSTNEFYKFLREELKNQGITGLIINDVSLKEGSFFSNRRRYLRIKWKEYQYDMCAAPFGKGFFISWWLLYKNSMGAIIISKIPFIGKWLVKKWYPITYYKVDTASMFMTYCHNAVLNVIDTITKESGIRISEQQRRPVLQDIFYR
jgi:hypothetical protein